MSPESGPQEAALGVHGGGGGGPTAAPHQMAANSGAGGGLPGSPALPFHVRCNLQHAQRGHLADCLMLVLYIFRMYRARHIIYPAAAAWQLALGFGCLANMAWGQGWGRGWGWHSDRQRQGAGPPRPHTPSSSYVRWRELLIALLRATSLGLGIGAVLVQRGISSRAVPESDEAGALVTAAHFARLLFASGAVQVATFAVAWRARLSVSVAVQALAVLSVMPHVRPVCDAMLSFNPSSQRDTRRVYRLLSLLGHPVPLPLAPWVHPDAAAECVTVITWFQLAIGLLLPLLLEARTAASLFRQHQRQRRAAGVPAEAGLHAALYDGLWGFYHRDHGMPVGVVLWVLMAVSWDWCAYICAVIHTAAAAVVAAAPA